ncbi:LuxR C-terminal-related transcriptional regulator [Alkalicoccus saliphilus]|nr:LuxR C-terminal-related transcriptional regulator [Alkalicoccus saliphilus]
MLTQQDDTQHVLLFCFDKDFEKKLEKLQVPEHVEVKSGNSQQPVLPDNADTLFVFANNPEELLKAARERNMLDGWIAKKVVFVVPSHLLEKAINALVYEIDGVISREVFMKDPEKAVKQLSADNFMLDPNLNFQVADQIDRAQKRKLPVERLKLNESEIGTLMKKSEISILQLLLDGKNTREIAEELFYTPKTVKRYISNIIRILEKKDRTEAVVEVIRRGWVSVERN